MSNRLRAFVTVRIHDNDTNMAYIKYGPEVPRANLVRVPHNDNHFNVDYCDKTQTTIYGIELLYLDNEEAIEDARQWAQTHGLRFPKTIMRNTTPAGV